MAKSKQSKIIKRSVFDRFAGQQRRVAEFIAQGMTIKDIATAMTLSHHTVRCHAQIVRAKIGAVSIYQAAAMLNRS